jgi:IS30 family transposase
MAARLSLDERVFIESALGAGRSVADVARRLGRDRSSVHRELVRCGGRADYDARWAHASAAVWGLLMIPDCERRLSVQR